MNAYDTLVSRGNLDKITVSAIAREADIDRKTFYLHYRSVDDLVSCKTTEIIERIITVLRTEGANMNHLERVHLALCELNSILTANIPVYANIASRFSTDQVVDHFARVSESALENAGIDPETAKSNHFYTKIQFYIAGAVYLYSTWLKSDRSQPIETVSNAIEEAITVMYRQGMHGKNDEAQEDASS